MHLIPEILKRKWFQLVLLFFIIFIHIILSPFTKVEESFQIQAIHDFLKIGFPKFYHCVYNFILKQDLDFNVNSCLKKTYNLSNYKNEKLFNLLPFPSNITYNKWDHEEFPGVVPRTFIPSFIISVVSWPFTFVIEEKFHMQIVVRLNLAILIIIPLLQFGEAIMYNFDKCTKILFFIITCTQFHFIYYASRTLPNTFALALVLWGYVFWLKRSLYILVLISAICVLIFRFETCIIFGVILLIEVFYYKSISILLFLSLGLFSGIFAIASTVTFDTFMWGRIVWPEFESMYFNLYLNKSHLWGTLPFYWYFVVAIPKIMLLSLCFCFFCSKKCCLKFYPIILIYIGLHSYLPHKELRFIIYIIPLLNVCAANSIAIAFLYLEENRFRPKSWLINSVYEYILKRKYNNLIEELYKLTKGDNSLIKKLDNLIIKKNERENFDSKEDSAYKTFHNDELKELEKIRSVNSLLRKRKSINLKQNENDVFLSKILSLSSIENKKNLSTENNEKISNLKNLTRKNKDSFLFKLENSLADLSNKTKDEIFLKLENLLTNLSMKNDNLNKASKKITIGFIIKFMLLTSHLCINFVISTYILFVSLNNYPGGDAAIWLNDNIPKHLSKYNLDISNVGIHVCNLAAQTGFTRFAEINGIVYDKSSNFLSLTNGINGSVSNTIFNNSNINYKREIISIDLKDDIQSLNVDLTQFKLVYLVLENIDSLFINNYCTPLKKTKSKLLFGIDRFECKFNKIKKCRIVNVIFGFNNIYFGLDRKFLNIKKIPMLYIYRCLNF